MDYYENLLRLYNVADPKGYSNLKKTSKRRITFCLIQSVPALACGCLKKMLARIQNCKVGMGYKEDEIYAKDIRKSQGN